eukprot:2982072-Prymnesium_polylepis.1
MATAWGDSAARGEHENMRHPSPTCTETRNAKQVEIAARPRSAHITCNTGARSAQTPPPRGHPGGGDAPSDPHEPGHRSGVGHRCGGRACGGLACSP